MTEGTNERGASRRGLPRWAWIAAGLLVAHSAAMIAAVVVALDDPSFKSVPDYYEQAVNWDQLQERRHRSAQLGWTATATPSAVGDRLVIDLLDQDGRPVEGARGSVSAYHHLDTRSVVSAPLVERGGGVYFASFEVGRVGAWQVTIAAERHAGEEFFDEQEVVVARGEAAR